MTLRGRASVTADILPAGKKTTPPAGVCYLVMFLVIGTIVYFIYLACRGSRDSRYKTAQCYHNQTLRLFSGCDNYRLGDVFSSKLIDYEFSAHGLKVWPTQRKIDFKGTLREYTLETFPESIAAEYIVRSKAQHDYRLLKQICTERAHAGNIPPGQALVMHLRLGDVIDYSKHTVDDFLQRMTCDTGCYVRPLHSIVDSAERSKMKKIVLVAGAHVPDPLPKSQCYLEEVARTLESRGYDVTMRLAGHPDDDLIYMSNARHFSPSNGGFSRIITRLVKMNGGSVY